MVCKSSIDSGGIPDGHDMYLPVSAVKPWARPMASTLAATSNPGERKTRMGIPGAASCKQKPSMR